MYLLDVGILYIVVTEHEIPENHLNVKYPLNLSPRVIITYHVLSISKSILKLKETIVASV